MGWRSQDVVHHTAQHCHLTVFLPVITTPSTRAFQHSNRAGCRKPMAKRVPDKLKLQSPNSGRPLCQRLHSAHLFIKTSFMQTRRSTQQAFSNTLSALYRAFDAVATWVTQLSWWKFFLFAALMLVAGKILQDELFSGGEEEITRTEHRARRP